MFNSGWAFAPRCFSLRSIQTNGVKPWWLKLNYQRIYNELIADRRASPPDAGTYSEVHHIVPRCMGGSDAPENLVTLSAECHFFAHLLLARIYGGKLWAAVHLMAGARLNGNRCLKSVTARHHRKKYARLMALARAKQTGANHPTSDKEQYDWEHINGLTFRGARYELRAKHGIDSRGIDNVLTGYAKTVSGWFVPELLSTSDLMRLRKNMGARGDRTVYTFRHFDGREFIGERWMFMEHSGVSRTMAQRLVSGGCHSASGWYLPDLNPDGVDGRHYCSGDRNGTAIKVVYHFRHVAGDEFIGTRMALVEQYGLSASAVHNMAKGVTATSGGWYMMDGEKPMHADNDNVYMQACLPLAA